MHKNFLNMLWEFTRGVAENRDSFIQKVLKMCKNIKVRSLKTPKLDVSPKKTEDIFFYKDMQEKKEKLKSVTVSQASAIKSRGWKNLKLVIRR